MNLTTDEGLRAYLSNIGYFCKSIENLSGGNANFVWRIRLDDKSEKAPNEELIVKHAEGYLRIDESIELPVARMDGEAKALQMVPEFLDLEPSHTPGDESEEPDLAVYIPQVQHYDSENHVLIMSSGGYKTLKAAYEDLSREQVHYIGIRLAHWIARLHARTRNADIGAGGNPIARKLYRISYMFLKDTLAEQGLGGANGELGATIDRVFGPLLGTDDECVAHGDFWPGNMVVDPADMKLVKMPLTVVDWEMTRRGIGATDVAQFAAEAYLLDRFRPVHHGLASTFVRKYIELVDPGDEFLKRFGVHWGTHVAFWPSKVPWGDSTQTKQVAEVGARVMEMAMNDEQGWIKVLMDEFDRYSGDK